MLDRSIGNLGDGGRLWRRGSGFLAWGWSGFLRGRCGFRCRLGLGFGFSRRGRGALLGSWSSFNWGFLLHFSDWFLSSGGRFLVGSLSRLDGGLWLRFSFSRRGRRTLLGSWCSFNWSLFLHFGDWLWSGLSGWGTFFGILSWGRSFLGGLWSCFSLFDNLDLCLRLINLGSWFGLRFLLWCLLADGSGFFGLRFRGGRLASSGSICSWFRSSFGWLFGLDLSNWFLGLSRLACGFSWGRLALSRLAFD